MKKATTSIVALVLGILLGIMGIMALKPSGFEILSTIRFIPTDIFVDIRAWVSYTGDEQDSLFSYTGATYSNGIPLDKAEDWIIGTINLNEENPALIITFTFTNRGGAIANFDISTPAVTGRYIKTGGLEGAENTNTAVAIRNETVTFRYIFSLTATSESFDGGSLDFTVLMYYSK